MTTVLDALAARLASAAAHSHAPDRAPVAVLWPDGDRKALAALPELGARLAQRWTLGAPASASPRRPAVGIEPCCAAGRGGTRC
jgi:hypothetical protein